MPVAPPETADLPSARRILHQAREHFFVHGYSSFTMDDLAAELGMSKKTLYVHFSGKDEIIGAVIQDLSDEVRTEAERILRDSRLTFAGKLHGFVASLLSRLASLDPRTLRDLQRFAPALYAKVEEMRRKNIPYIFGRLVEEGQQAGFVRAEPSASFAIEFFLHGVQGMVHPATLDRLALAPREAIAGAIELFFGGLLTPAGRKQYEKIFPR